MLMPMPMPMLICWWQDSQMAVFLHKQKSYDDNNVNILRTKRAFKMKQKTFIIFKGLSLEQIKPTLLES